MNAAGPKQPMRETVINRGQSAVSAIGDAFASKIVTGLFRRGGISFSGGTEVIKGGRVRARPPFSILDTLALALVEC